MIGRDLTQGKLVRRRLGGFYSDLIRLTGREEGFYLGQELLVVPFLRGINLQSNILHGKIHLIYVTSDCRDLGLQLLLEGVSLGLNTVIELC